MLPNFAIEGRSSTLSSYAAAWEWWYSDPKAAKSSEQIQSIGLRISIASIRKGFTFRMRALKMSWINSL
jgi:hypothetical protein